LRAFRHEALFPNALFVEQKGEPVKKEEKLWKG
jgi:hypothetical protein